MVEEEEEEEEGKSKGTRKRKEEVEVAHQGHMRAARSADDIEMRGGFKLSQWWMTTMVH